MSEYVITAKKIGTDEPYLSAIFRREGRKDMLMGIIQNERVSANVDVAHVASFLLAIRSDDRYYPEEARNDGKKYILENTKVMPAIDVIGNDVVELDF